MPINLREHSDRLTLSAMLKIFDDFAAGRVTAEKSLEKIHDLGLEPTKGEADTEWNLFFRTLQILADGVTDPLDRHQGTLGRFGHVFDDIPVDASSLCEAVDNLKT
jgi:hypothetical protein